MLSRDEIFNMVYENKSYCSSVSHRSLERVSCCLVFIFHGSAFYSSEWSFFLHHKSHLQTKRPKKFNTSFLILWRVKYINKILYASYNPLMTELTKWDWNEDWFIMGCNKKWEMSSTAFQTIDREYVSFREAFSFDLSESKVSLDMIQSQQIRSKMFIS